MNNEKIVQEAIEILQKPIVGETEEIMLRKQNALIATAIGKLNRLL